MQELPRKRRHTSRAGKMAIDISKLLFSVHDLGSGLTVKGDKIVFANTAKLMTKQSCSWKDETLPPCYCENAALKFETHLPDRRYLTRYTVQCQRCYQDDFTATHLYCTYCDEVLMGSIAGPGGKVSDHLITIKHVFQQATTLKSFSDQLGYLCPQDCEQAREYVSKLEEWSDTVRFPSRSTIKRIHFEDIIRSLQSKIDEAPIQALVSKSQLRAARAYRRDLRSSQLKSEWPDQNRL
jgi:hypothetical protein